MGYKRIISSIMLFIAVITAFPKAVIADEPDNISIKLGYYEYAGFFDFHEDGKGDGYINLYTDLLENYTDYDFSYTKYDYKKDINALINGDIDLVCYPEDILNTYDDLCISSNSVANECGTLYVTEDNNINYEDYSNMNGMKIAVLSTDTIYKDILKDYAEKNDFTYKSVEYDDLNSAVNAVKRGDVDSILSGSLRNITELKKIAAFGDVSYRLAATKANSELINNIDNITNEIQLNNCDFEADIYHAVYRDCGFNKVVLTTQEKSYVDSKKTINVAYAENVYPLGYTSEDGEFVGYFNEVGEYIENSTGLELNFVKYSTAKECVQAVNNGTCDAVIGITSDFENSSSIDLNISESFLEMSLLKIAEKQSGFLNYTSYTTSDYIDYISPVEEAFREDLLDVRENLEDCIESVIQGDNSFAIIPEYVWFSYVKDDKYADLEVDNLEGYSLQLAFGLSNKSSDNSVCVDILNKAITGMKNQCPSQIIFDIDRQTLSDNTIIGVIKNNKPYLAFIIIIIIVSAFSYYVVRKKNDKQLLLSDIAYTDSITGYSNYNKFIIDANKKMKFRDVKYAVGYLDVNNFKSINDYYGRLAGNKVLLSLSEKISDLVNPNGIFARIFADRFVFLVDYLDISTLEYTIKTYLTQIDVYLDEKKDAIKITCSCGIYLVKENEINVYNMIDKAQMAVKMAKQSLSKNVAIFDDETNMQLLKNQKLTSNMDKALEDREFTVYMQPKYDIATEKIYGAEALVRWNSPEFGFISPNDFIPLFEKNGFVTQVDFYVLEEVCKYLRYRLDNNLKVVPVAVNQSRLHVLDSMYISKIEDLLDKYNINSSLIIFELTESAFTENPDEMVALIKRMNSLGYTISMDDFGSGYSSLNMLKELPLAELKVDKEFLSGTSNFEKTRYIVKTLVEMAHGLQLKVVCEGVETSEHLEFLKEIECDIAQGYYFSRPVSMEEFSKLLQ